jgi:hypothetical protein
VHDLIYSETLLSHHLTNLNRIKARYHLEVHQKCSNAWPPSSLHSNCLAGPQTLPFPLQDHRFTTVISEHRQRSFLTHR